MHPWLRHTFQSHWLAEQQPNMQYTLPFYDFCMTVAMVRLLARLRMDVFTLSVEQRSCVYCKPKLFIPGPGAHMLVLLQDVTEIPGCSAAELLPSVNSHLDEAQVLHEQPSEDAPVLQGDILPKAQVCSNPV